MADLSSLERQIQELRERVSHLEGLIASGASVPPKKAAPPPQAPQPVAKPAIAPPPPLPRPPRRSLEDTIGMRWFNLIGALALIIAVGYFLQYAIENEWIGAKGRVALGMLFGTGMIVWGDALRLNTRYRILSVGMNGIGISSLYLSVYAAYDFYHFIPQAPAFVLLILLTGVTVFFALRYDSLTIAFVGMIGGFLTPALVSTGENHPVSLFSYLLILDAGVLALALYKRWRSLNIFSVIFSYLWYSLWYLTYYSRDQLGTAFMFLTLFFLLFAMIAMARNIVEKTKTGFLDGAVIIMNAIIYFPFALVILEPHESLHGLFALLVGALYLGFGAFAYRRNREDTRVLFLFLSLALTALIVAVPLQFHGHWVTVAWATEALGLWYLSCRFKSEKATVVAFILFVLTVAHLLVNDSGLSAYNAVTNRYDFTPILNQRFALYGYVMACAYGAVLLSRKLDLQPTSFRKLAQSILVVGAAFGLLVALSLDVESTFDALQWNAARDTQGVASYSRDYNNASRLTLSGVWMLYSMILIGVGFVRKNKAVRIMAIVIFGITIVKVSFYDLSFLEGFYRIASFALLGLILLLVSYLYQKFKGSPDEQSGQA